jgi:hypothetical protein
LAAVTNGHQIVAFVAVRTDGVPPLEGRALVFPNFDVMVEHFRELWDSLSRAGVERKLLTARLLGESRQELPPKLSATIPSYPGIEGRNVFQTDLQIVSEVVLEDRSRTRELQPRFLDETYCRTGTLSQYALTSKTILQARYAALFDPAEKAPTTVSAVDKRVTAALRAETTIDRRDFGVTRNAAMDTGGAYLGERVQISLSIMAAPPGLTSFLSWVL